MMQEMRLPDWLTTGSATPLAAFDYKPSGKPTFIYGLVDPRTFEVRYIGKTHQSLNARLRAHMLDTGNCHRVHWMQQLAALNLVPDIIIFEMDDQGWNW